MVVLLIIVNVQSSELVTRNSLAGLLCRKSCKLKPFRVYEFYQLEIFNIKSERTFTFYGINTKIWPKPSNVIKFHMIFPI